MVGYDREVAVIGDGWAAATGEWPRGPERLIGGRKPNVRFSPRCARTEQSASGPNPVGVAKEICELLVI